MDILWSRLRAPNTQADLDEVLKAADARKSGNFAHRDNTRNSVQLPQTLKLNVQVLARRSRCTGWSRNASTDSFHCPVSAAVV